MTHTPAVDSLEHMKLGQALVAWNRRNGAESASIKIGQEYVVAAAIAALTRPVGGSDRLRELLLKAAGLVEDTTDADTDEDASFVPMAAPFLIALFHDAARLLASPQPAPITCESAGITSKSEGAEPVRVRHSCETDMLSDCPACSADADAAIANDGTQGAEQRQEGCGACDDGCVSRGRCRLADESPAMLPPPTLLHEHAGDGVKVYGYTAEQMLAHATPHPEPAATQGDADLPIGADEIPRIGNPLMVGLRNPIMCTDADLAETLAAIRAERETAEDATSRACDAYRDACGLEASFVGMQAALSSPPGVQAAQVSDAMVERAMNARIPGGSQAWVWLFNCEGGMRPEDKHRDWFRRVLEAALAQPGSAAHGGENSP